MSEYNMIHIDDSIDYSEYPPRRWYEDHIVYNNKPWCLIEVKNRFGSYVSNIVYDILLTHGKQFFTYICNRILQYTTNEMLNYLQEVKQYVNDQIKTEIDKFTLKVLYTNGIETIHKYAKENNIPQEKLEKMIKMYIEKIREYRGEIIPDPYDIISETED